MLSFVHSSVTVSLFVHSWFWSFFANMPAPSSVCQWYPTVHGHLTMSVFGLQRLKQSYLAPELSTRRYRQRWPERHRGSRAVPWHREVAWFNTGLRSDDRPARHWSFMQLQLSHACTASHPPSTLPKYYPQCRLIVAGLPQYTTARHVCHQSQQTTSGTEHTGQGDVSTSVSATETTALIANLLANSMQYRHHYI